MNLAVIISMYAADAESLKGLGSSRLLPSNPRSLQSSLNPEGIYV